MTTYGARDIAQNSSVLRIGEDDLFMVEDKKSHKQLGLYIGMNLAKKFLEFQKKERLLESAKKIKDSSKIEAIDFEDMVDDGL